VRQELREAEEKQNALFDKKLAQEETWMRQGVKARRTRNEGRVRALMELRRQRSLRRRELGSATMAHRGRAERAQGDHRLEPHLRLETACAGHPAFSTPCCAGTRSASSARTAAARRR
jgi:ATPase subunit of ABC transporter with duplicated ATPase domains